MEFINNLPPILQVIVCSMFTYIITACGAGLVFFFKKINRKILDIMMGFSAGIMIAASFWSLLAPALDLSNQLGYIEWIMPAIGFLLGTALVLGTELLIVRSKIFKKLENDNISSFKRSVLLTSSVTLHNIPEGLAVGVAFGSVLAGVTGYEITGAILLAIGVGIQNFPEGASISLPLRRDGMSRKKAFFFGQLSGLVEPIAAVLGFYLAISVRAILPLVLSLSAGAMITVACAELIPESTKENKSWALIGLTFGFIVMMILDVSLG